MKYKVAADYSQPSAVHEIAIAMFTDEEYLSGIFHDELRRNLFILPDQE